MKIVEIREKTLPIRSPIRNAYIDFSKMTLSLVAVVTDVVRDGKPVVGYGFNSNGRYGQGALMRERFIPRLLEADAETPARRRGDEPRSAQGLGRDDAQREARRPRRALGRGRHDRHGGVGRGGEDRGQAAVPAARGALRRRRAEPRGLRLRRRRLLLPGQGPRRAAARDAQLPRSRLLGREDEDRRRARSTRTASASRRCCACSAPGSSSRVDANGRFDLDTAIEYAKALSQYDLFWYEEAGDPLDFALQAELAQLLRRARWRPARTCSRCRTRAT